MADDKFFGQDILFFHIFNDRADGEAVEPVTFNLGFIGKAGVNGIINRRSRSVGVESRVGDGENGCAFKSRNKLLNLAGDDGNVKWSAVFSEFELPKTFIIDNVVLGKVIPWRGGTSDDGF